jgi:hypothetical protein
METSRSSPQTSGARPTRIRRTKLTNLGGNPVASLNLVLTAAGPIDANGDGEEFIYIEAASNNFYALCQLVSPGVFNALYVGRLTPTMIDTPWGMGGFAFDHTFDHGGIIYKQPYVIDRTDLSIQVGPNPYPLAIEGQTFSPMQQWPPELLLAGFFRSTVQMNSFYMSRGTLPTGTPMNTPSPPEFLTQGMSPLPSGAGWTAIYQSAIGVAGETALGTFATSGQISIAGVAPFTNAYNRLYSGGAPWPIQNLLYWTGSSWTSILTNSTLPDSTAGAKAFYQGVTAHGCQLEFATKRDTGALDGGGAFNAMYRLYRPCLNSAHFNPDTGQLVVTGTNL